LGKQPNFFSEESGRLSSGLQFEAAPAAGHALLKLLEWWGLIDIAEHSKSVRLTVTIVCIGPSIQMFSNQRVIIAGPGFMFLRLCWIVSLFLQRARSLWGKARWISD
jgi:hypothetical protein